MTGSATATPAPGVPAASPRPVRIAQVIQSVDPRSGGTSTAFLELVAALATQRDAGIETHAFAPAPPDRAAVLERLPEHARGLLRFTGPQGRFRPGPLARTVIEAIRERPFDAVHLHAVWCPDLVAIAAAARRSGAITLWQPHGMLVDRAMVQSRLKKQLFLAMGLKRELTRAGAIVFCSPREKSISVPLGPPADDRRVVVPLPVDLPFAEDQLADLRARGRARFGYTDADRVVVFVGRIHPVKRVPMLIDAFARVRSRHAEARLLLVGDGDEEELTRCREGVASRGLDDAVRFAGWIDPAERFEAFAAGDCLSLQSMFENFGYVVPEALAVGTPAVVTDNLAMAEGVASDDLGAVAGEDAERLAEALSATLSRSWTDDDRRRGRAWVDRVFSHRAVGAKLGELFARLRS
ncbi:MAG: glycosyltransferase [Phycisphaerales bacterium JB037]